MDCFAALAMTEKFGDDWKTLILFHFATLARSRLKLRNALRTNRARIADSHRLPASFTATSRVAACWLALDQVWRGRTSLRFSTSFLKFQTTWSRIRSEQESTRFSASIETVIPGRCVASNPESRDSGSGANAPSRNDGVIISLRCSSWPGMTEQRCVVTAFSPRAAALRWR